MRYAVSEKLEILRLVEGSHLSARQTLAMLGIPRTAFYRWFDRYLRRGEAGLVLGETLAGSVTVEYSDSLDLTISLFGSGGVDLGGDHTTTAYFEFYEFDAPQKTEFLATDEFFDEAFTFKFAGDSGSLRFDGMLDDSDSYELSAYSAFFTLFNVSMAGKPKLPVIALANASVPASLPFLGGGLLEFWVVRHHRKSS